jgi:hypothetical protein
MGGDGSRNNVKGGRSLQITVFSRTPLGVSHPAGIRLLIFLPPPSWGHASREPGILFSLRVERGWPRTHFRVTEHFCVMLRLWVLTAFIG